MNPLQLGLMLQGTQMVRRMSRDLQADAMPTLTAAEMTMMPQLSGMISTAASFSAISTSALVQPTDEDQRTRTISEGAWLLGMPCLCDSPLNQLLDRQPVCITYFGRLRTSSMDGVALSSPSLHPPRFYRPRPSGVDTRSPVCIMTVS